MVHPLVYWAQSPAVLSSFFSTLLTPFRHVFRLLHLFHIVKSFVREPILSLNLSTLEWRRRGGFSVSQAILGNTQYEYLTVAILKSDSVV